MPKRTTVGIPQSWLRSSQYLLATKRIRSVLITYSPLRFIIATTTFQPVAVTDVVLVLLFEFVVTRGCECCSPKHESFFYIKPDSLHQVESSLKIQKISPSRIIRIVNGHNDGDVFRDEAFCEDGACIEDNA
jgi:hypothetical protein